MNRPNPAQEHGFSLLELLVATAIFIVLTGAIFGLLVMAQQRYQSETQVLDSFQQASLAMDQMVRDVHTAGYPPVNSFNQAVACGNLTQIAWPFAYAPNYPNYPANPCPAFQGAACTVGASCTTPSAWDLIVEETADPAVGVEFIRYQLNGTTLMRGVLPKIAAAGAPDVATTGILVPYVDNVMNNPSAAQMAAIQAAYPGMFPGNNPVPLFTYVYDGAAQEPENIRQVNIDLIVQAPSLDPKTRQVRIVSLTGQSRRINPNK
jgi:prepilin-type N-terminal cleavage/methylation domain-containing protein